MKNITSIFSLSGDKKKRGRLYSFAIVIAAPIARDITEEYGVDPRQTASLLDTGSCIAQGIIPYGAQLLVAANIAGLTSVSLIPFLIYPFILLVFVIISIQRTK